MSPIAGAFVWKYCSKTLSAAGAAAVPPWPPFSMTAQSSDRRAVGGRVAAPPGLIEQQRVAVARQLHDLLGRASLAGDRDREAAEDRARRPVRGVRGVVERALDHLDRRRVGAAVGRRRRLKRLDDRRRRVLAAGLLDGGHHVRSHELAAVRDEREETRHLQRRDGDVLLADRQLDRVTRLPELVDLVRVRRLAPLGGRQDPLRLGPDVHARQRADAEAAGPRLERMAALRGQVVEHRAEAVEVRVAGGSDRLRHPHRPVDVEIPVVEHLVGAGDALHPVRACARQQRVLVDQMLLQSGECRDRLERRARRIDGRGSAVQAGVVLAARRLGVEQRLQLLVVPPGVDARPEGRVRRHREDVAVVGIEGDDRAAVGGPLAVRVRACDAVLQRALGGALHRDVNREPEVVA